MRTVRNRIKYLVLVTVLALSAATTVLADDTPMITTANAMAHATKKVTPEFPVAAKQLHISGSQEIQVLVSKTGEVTEVKVLKGNMMFSGSSTAAAKQWKFAPLMKDGTAIEFAAVLIFNYGQ